jgi:hypothetical protein
MADIFDSLDNQPSQDIFDTIATQSPQQSNGIGLKDVMASIISNMSNNLYSPQKVKSSLGWQPANDVQGAGLGKEIAQQHQDPFYLNTVAEAFRKAKEEVPGMMGMVAGGLVGTPAGPGGVVAGAGLGYAGAKQLYRFMTNPTQPGYSLADQMARTGRDVLEGAQMEMGGQVLGKIIPAIWNTIGTFKAMEGLPDRQEISKFLQSYGGKGLTPAEETGNRTLQFIESGLDKNIASTSQMNAYRKTNFDATNQYKNEILKGMGGSLPREVSGEMTQAVASKNEQAWRKLRNDAYDEVEKLLPKGEPVPTPNLSQTANSIAEELGQSRLNRGDIYNTAKTLIEKPGIFSKGKPAGSMDIQYADIPSNRIGNEAFPYGSQTKTGTVNTPPTDAEWMPFQDTTWTGLKQDREWLTSQISQAHRSGDSQKVRLFSQMKDALDKDVSAFSESMGNGAKEAYDWAQQIAGAGSNVFKDKKILTGIVNNNTPEKIAGNFLKPNNATNVKLLKSAVGDEGLQPLKQSWLEGLVTSGAEKSFSPQQFATNFNNYDKETLTAFLSPSEYTSLKKLAEVSQVLGEVERKAGNPSGTARAGTTIATGFGLIKHPLVTALELMSANRFAKAYLGNPQFKNWVLGGLKLPADSSKAIELAYKVKKVADESNR